MSEFDDAMAEADQAIADYVGDWVVVTLASGQRIGPVKVFIDRNARVEQGEVLTTGDLVEYYYSDLGCLEGGEKIQCVIPQGDGYAQCSESWTVGRQLEKRDVSEVRHLNPPG